MVSSAVSLESIDKEQARKLALIYIDTILQFMESISRKPRHGFHSRVLFLKEMRWRIDQSSVPIRNDNEVKMYLNPIRDAIIGFNPAIAKQLHNFWEAQSQIIQAANNKKERFDSANLMDENHEKIANINKRFDEVLERFVADSDDEINIDAVLYMHILRTEAYGKKLQEQLQKTLERYEIADKFNAAEIYSVTKPTLQKTRRKDRYLSDAECIRNALAHNNYEIAHDANSWKIKFDNQGEHGYIFKQQFTKREFRWYLSNTEILYKASTTLIYLLHLWAIVRNRLL